MFVYLPLQVPLLIGVAALLIADGLWKWPPIQTETAQTLLAACVFIVATLIAVRLDRAADPNFLPANVMWTAFLPASVLVFGSLRLCLFLLRRRHVSAARRGPLAGLIAVTVTALTPATALVAGCIFYGLCP